MKGWNWDRFFWFAIAGIFLVNALMQTYQLGYDNAKWYYEDREFYTKTKHTDEIVDLIKQKATPNQKLFQSLAVGEPYDQACDSLHKAQYEMMDYLVPCEVGYISYWIDRKGETKTRQTWVAITKDKATGQLASKEMTVRRTPGTEETPKRKTFAGWLFEGITIGEPYEETVKLLRGAKYDTLRFFNGANEVHEWMDRSEDQDRTVIMTIDVDPKTKKVVSKQLVVK